VVKEPFSVEGGPDHRADTRSVHGGSLCERSRPGPTY
jgi:hypothetical protein